MAKDFFLKLKELPRLKLLIIIFTVWQYFSVAGMALLNWSNSLVWLNLGLLLAFIALCPVYESLLLLILSIPFYVAIPNSRFDSLSMWRILFAVLFVVWFVKDKRLKIKDIHCHPWDKYLGRFVAVGFLAAMLFGSFRWEAFKQVWF